MRAFVAAVIAVLSAFIGIRKKGAAVRDGSLRPAHIIVAALLCVATLVICIIFLVRSITP